jgi:hypothetical protein
MRWLKGQKGSGKAIGPTPVEGSLSMVWRFPVGGFVSLGALVEMVITTVKTKALLELSARDRHECLARPQ